MASARPSAAPAAAPAATAVAHAAPLPGGRRFDHVYGEEEKRFGEQPE